jgi:dihydroflavonol-4-reductase
MRTINVSITVNVAMTCPTEFVSASIIRFLLEEGFTLRCLLHPDKATNAKILWDLGEKYENRLTVIKVDLAKNDLELAAALSGVHFVVHSLMHCSDRASLLGLLAACNAPGSATIRRFILTEDLSAVTRTGVASGAPEVVTEADWGSGDVADMEKLCVECFEPTDGATPSTVELVRIICGDVIGPPFAPNAPLSAPMQRLADVVSGVARRIPAESVPLVDARDVARAHMHAMLSPGSARGRYIVVNQTFRYEDLCSMLRHDVPRYCPEMPKTVDKLRGWLHWTLGGAVCARNVQRLLTSRSNDGERGVAAGSDRIGPGGAVLYANVRARQVLQLGWTPATVTLVDTVIALAANQYIVDKSGPPPKDEEGDYYYVFS